MTSPRALLNLKLILPRSASLSGYECVIVQIQYRQLAARMLPNYTHFELKSSHLV